MATRHSERPRDGAETFRGKRIGNRTYAHREALPYLQEADQTKIELAAQLANNDEWNVAKWAEDSDVVSLLCYSEFFTAPFPRLEVSFTVNVASGHVSVRRYNQADNCPILHRKELLLPPDHPCIPDFQHLTRQLEAAGVLNNARYVGYERQWLERLEQYGYSVVNHALEPDPLDGDAVTEGQQRADSSHEIQRHKTAINRRQLSAPLQALNRHNYLDGTRTLFDYGCGRGGDLAVVQRYGITASGWDPHYRPEEAVREADLVNLGFVLNVIESRSERAEILQHAFQLARELLVVAVMLGEPDLSRYRIWGDGVLTSRGTFQKYYSQAELRQFLEQTLDVDPIPVGPGIFFVHRSQEDAQQFREKRSTSRPTPTIRWDPPSRKTGAARGHRFYIQNQRVLDGLWAIYSQLGRRPRPDEVPNLQQIEESCESLKRALRFLERYHGAEAVAAAERKRQEDLRVFLALELFSNRKPKDYTLTLRRDIRRLFGSQDQALAEGKALLESLADPQTLYSACRSAVDDGLGHLQEDRAYFVHTDLLEQLPAELRAYIGCATYLYGDPSAADLIKVHIGTSKLSLMRYDDFEGSPLPRLMERVKLNYRTQDFDVFVYGEEFDPPYLYLKSRYIPPEFPHYVEQRAFDDKLASLSWLDFSGLGPPKARFHDELHRRWLTIDGFDLVPIDALPGLDHRCGEHLTFRDLIECGETQRSTGLPNVPEQPATFAALAHLTREVLDPVMDYFGGIELTYGFAGPALGRRVPSRNEPKLDQHASYEFNQRGNRVCERGGAAVDFLVPDEDMAEVAHWVAENTPFDRLYFYGAERPIHVSIGPEHKREIVRMVTSTSGRRTPRVLNEPAKLLKGSISRTNTSQPF